jgi:glycosyltransferase involved in cell wall biosynthesis
LRHLHFTQSLEPLQGGGLGVSAISLHEQMRLTGLPSVLCSTYGVTPQHAVEGIAEFERIKPASLYYSPAMRRSAPELVRETDVLHGHGLYVGTNFVFGREAYRQRKPMVYHVHGMFEPYILQRSKWKKRLVHWLFEDRNMRDVRWWRALTEKEADQIRACGAKQPIVVIPNGLDATELSKPIESVAPIETPLIRDLSKNSLRVLFLGRVHPKKGLDLLLSAWARLSTSIKDWELVIAGPDEGGYLSRLRALSASLGLGNRIAFTGLVTGDAKKRLLHSADLFVLPSYSEGFPMSVLEAWACEVPVLVTRECNVGDLSTTAAGWECDANVDSLTSALKLALSASEAERRNCGQNGRRLIDARYSWPDIISKLEQSCAAYC